MIQQEIMRQQQIVERQRWERQRMEQERVRQQQIVHRQRQERQRMEQERVRQQQIVHCQRQERQRMEQGAGSKRALLVGCTYNGTKKPLPGTLNNIEMIRFTLEKEFGFHRNEIMMLVEGTSSYDKQPDRRNILNGIKWLTRKEGGNIFFYFSGHGGKSSSHQYICPMDCSHVITSSELHENLVMKVGKNTTLYALIDACHSGNVLSLPFLANTSGGTFKKWDACVRSHEIHNQTSPGCVYQFSATTPDEVGYQIQHSSTGFAKLLGNQYIAGAATHAFCKGVLKRSNLLNRAATLSEVIEHMHFELRHSKKYPQQTPTISSDSPKDCSQTSFSL